MTKLEAMMQEYGISDYRFEGSKIENEAEIKALIKNNALSLQAEEASLYMTLIEQQLSHYTQLLMKMNTLFKEEDINSYIKLGETFKSAFLDCKNKADVSLDDLIGLHEKITSSYQENVNVVENFIKNQKAQEAYQKDLMTLNQYLDTLNKQDVNPFDIPNLPSFLTLYQTVIKNIHKGTMSDKVASDIKTLLAMIEEMPMKDNHPQEAMEEDKAFDLFAKINDFIVDQTYYEIGALLYGDYLLEDGSHYLAIIESEATIKEQLKHFKPLETVELTRNAVEQMLLTVLTNCQIYYQVNEYMRYLEKTNKNQMTKALDLVIKDLKQQLATMEKSLHQQLQFVDLLAPLLHGKETAAFPGLHYQDTAPEDFYPATTLGIDEMTKVKRRLIVDVFANDKVRSALTSTDLRKSLYDPSLISPFHEPLKKPIQKSEVPVVSSVINDDIGASIITNPEKVRNYLAIRKEELAFIGTKGKQNVSFSRDDNLIYEDVNTVFDLLTAVAISDKVYQEGQGLFALKEYLTTGKALKFTSKYGARNLALKVSRKAYLYLLMENALWRYLVAPTSFGPLLAFIDKSLQEHTFSIPAFEQKLLEDDTLLEEAVMTFDDKYLDPTSKEMAILESTLKNFSSPLIEQNEMIKIVKELRNKRFEKEIA